jgi:carbon storage regulator CsrA
MALSLTRKEGESIKLTGSITVTVVTVGVGQVKIEIDAPPEIQIVRSELLADPTSVVPVRGLLPVSHSRICTVVGRVATCPTCGATENVRSSPLLVPICQGGSIYFHKESSYTVQVARLTCTATK